MGDSGLAYLIGLILLENHTNTSKKLLAECAHGDTVGFALPQLLVEENVQVGIPAPSYSSSHPQSFSQTQLSPPGDMSLNAQRR